MNVSSNILGVARSRSCYRSRINPKITLGSVKRFFLLRNVHNDSEPQPELYTRDTAGSYRLGEVAGGVKLIIHLYLSPTLRISGILPELRPTI
jgi:hypothetical protein